MRYINGQDFDGFSTLFDRFISPRKWTNFIEHNCPAISPLLHTPLHDPRNNEVLARLKRYSNPFKRILEELKVCSSFSAPFDCFYASA